MKGDGWQHSPDMPAVGKTGSAHAGKGKIKLTSAEMFEDYASLVALQVCVDVWWM